MGKGEDVVIEDYGPVEKVDKDWPRGEFLVEVLTKEGVSPLEQGDATYWQASARWALLRKYGFPELPTLDFAYTTNEETGHRQLNLTPEEITAIQTRWDCLARQCDSGSNDLLNFVKHGVSNKRSLKWSVMRCAPGCQFRLHAHPNLELIYCAKGALHEIRMKGEPYVKASGKKSNGELVGPNLTRLNRPWYFDTLYSGEWLVNEVGSIHKSFTGTSGDGCILLVLWGGSHANIGDDQAPATPNVQQAVDTMDDRLKHCDNCGPPEKLSETFLPDSEKRHVRHATIW